MTDVQWFRGRCNEYFEKAELVKGRLVGDIPDSAMLAEKLIFNRALEMVRFFRLLMKAFSAECLPSSPAQLLSAN